MKYLSIILILLFGCLRSPVGIEAEPKVIYVEILKGIDSLQFAGYYSGLMYSEWTDEFGVIFFTGIINKSNKDWYGHPEIDIHTSDILLSTFNDSTLIGHGEGILTTDVIAGPIPIDTVDFIPPQKLRESLTFAPVDPEDLKIYYYILRSFKENERN